MTPRVRILIYAIVVALSVLMYYGPRWFAGFSMRWGTQWRWRWALWRLRAGLSLSWVQLAALARWLYDEYHAGALHPEVLARCAAACPRAPMPNRQEFAVDAVNKLVCVEVAAGRYREALEWRARWVGQARDLSEPWQQVLAINEAEALAGLGRLDEALGWPGTQDNYDFLEAGRASHRGWVLATQGRAAEAKRVMSRSSAEELPIDYQSEWHLSQAAVALAEGRFAEAAIALEKAELKGIRASTQRNVVFMRAQVARARGDHESAVALFAEGARHRYQGQGGDALLAWGDSLVALGRREEALAAWKLCVERDPQSPAAGKARERMTSPVDRPSP